MPLSCLLEPPLNATTYINGWIGATKINSISEVSDISFSGIDPNANPFATANFGGVLAVLVFKESKHF